MGRQLPFLRHGGIEVGAIAPGDSNPFGVRLPRRTGWSSAAFGSRFQANPEWIMPGVFLHSVINVVQV